MSERRRSGGDSDLDSDPVRVFATRWAGSNSNNTGNGNGNGNGGGQRAASQPPHHSSSPFLSPTIPSSLSTGGAGGGNTSGPWAGLTPSSVSARSASFSAPRFASTFEDDELVDPDDELYDARYHSPTSASSYTHNTLYRGRPGTNAPPDFSRSRSQSLATATAIGTGRAGGGLGSGYAVGSAANSYSNAYLYGNNAYGHPYGGGGGGGGAGVD
ncbi:hypothetical protein B0H13DRAFT_2378711 [Mycena leptocephala]|nr:hypothetical protein B0H13DRAFT_2378711 [Mycena leptocephala]